MRFVALFLLAAATALAAETRPIPSPAGEGSMAPNFSRAPAGGVLLSWLEPIGEREWALKWATFDEKRNAWSEPRTIQRGNDWFANWADTPSVTALSEDVLMAVWFVNNPPQHDAKGHHGSGYHARYSITDDGGKTWSQPQATTAESKSTEFTTVLALNENSRALAAWLDGRKRATGREEQALYAQTFLATGADHLVDPLVCDCCQLSMVKLQNSALLAYRGRTSDEVRDIRIARWRDGVWEKPRDLHDDGWKIAACPVNGPKLAASGKTVAAAWFTAAQETPRVQVKFSQDEGETWSSPTRFDLGHPAGRIDALLLDETTVLVSWLERGNPASKTKGGVYLRSIRASGQVSEPVLVAPSGAERATGFPRMARVDERHVMVAITTDRKPTRVETLLIAVK